MSVELDIIIAIVLAVVASGSFALGATLQHLGVKRNFHDEGTESRSMTFKRLLQLLVTPLWIGGLALVAFGAGIHIVALKLAPLTVVQPVGILAVPFSILLANRIHKTRTSSVMWGAVAITVAGIVGFTLLSSITAVEHSTPDVSSVWIAAGVIWVFGLIFAALGWKGPRWIHCLAWAWAGAFLYGLGSGFIKLLTIYWSTPGDVLFWGSALGLAVSYAVGGWMIQQAYASGPAEIVVGVMTTVDPVVAVAFGLIVLGEGRAITPLVAVGMAVAALVSAYGVFVLSKHHPEAAAHRAENPPVEAAPHEGNQE